MSEETRDFESPNHGSNPCAGTRGFRDRPPAALPNGLPNGREAGDASSPPRRPLASHRVEVARGLSAGIVAALAAGDVLGAQAAVAALADLVRAFAGEQQRQPEGRAGAVDLEAERRKRGAR